MKPITDFEKNCNLNRTIAFNELVKFVTDEGGDWHYSEIDLNNKEVMFLASNDPKYEKGSGYKAAALGYTK